MPKGKTSRPMTRKERQANKDPKSGSRGSRFSKVKEGIRKMGMSQRIKKNK